jgi:hypothetical protein
MKKWLVLFTSTLKKLTIEIHQQLTAPCKASQLFTNAVEVFVGANDQVAIGNRWRSGKRFFFVGE